MTTCSIEGCGGKRHGYGLCRKHYSILTAHKRKEWRKANPEKVKGYKRAYHAKNAEKIKAKVMKWVSENPEKRRANVRKWDKEHADQCAAKLAKRRATKLNATPKWANAFFIKEAYHLAKLRTKVTGFEWHVDHIVPLQHKLVCGLHVESNLRVIPAMDNRIKSNTNWPDMPN